MNNYILYRKLPIGGYCYRLYDHDQYLHDVGELRAMGYDIDDRWNSYIIKLHSGFKGLHLHIDYNGVELHNHTVGAECVPNLEYIINELPVL